MTPEMARDLASQLLEEPLPRRWAHTQGVAAAATALSGILGEDADLITTSAWLHDIGYSPALEASGFHPLDGARYLRDTHHIDEVLCCLVAHHSGALTEAAERGLAGELAAEFAFPPADLYDALSYSDYTTGPDGQHLTVDERIAEIVSRYGPGHLVTRSVERGAPEMRATASRVRARLAGASALQILVLPSGGGSHFRAA
jgi:hypothetical protein